MVWVSVEKDNVLDYEGVERLQCNFGCVDVTVKVLGEGRHEGIYCRGLYCRKLQGDDRGKYECDDGHHYSRDYFESLSDSVSSIVLTYKFTKLFPYLLLTLRLRLIELHTLCQI